MSFLDAKESILEMIRSAEEQFTGTGRPILDIEEYVAEYLADGRVMVLPCAVGTVVYFVHDCCKEEGEEFIGIDEGKVCSFSLQEDGLWAYCRYNSGLTYWHKVKEDFGKKVFLVREAAEAAKEKGDFMNKMFDRLKSNFPVGPFVAGVVLLVLGLLFDAYDMVGVSFIGIIGAPAFCVRGCWLDRKKEKAEDNSAMDNTIGSGSENV